MDIRLDEVVVNDRMRALNSEKVAQIAHSISEIGLLNPITVKSVNNHYELVAGLHRLEAFKILKRETIPAQIFDGNDLDAELAEIDENLRRNELTVLEQGEHLLRRNEILEARGERAAGYGNGSNQFESKGETVSPLLTTSDIAAEVGLSERSAQQRLQVARDIIPSVKEIIRDTDIAQSTTQLLTLARMGMNEQKDVAEVIFDGRADSVNQAISILQTKYITKEILPHVSFNSGQNEWYTPPEYIEAARAVMGDIDLDPASSEIANRTVQAKTYYTAQDDGLSYEWRGRIWMNPPYSSEWIGKFTEKLTHHFSSGDVAEAMVFVNNATETGWFQGMLDCASAVCFPRQRVKFLDPDGNPGAPLQGQAVLYFGANKEKFKSEFEKFGKVLYGD